MTPTALRFSVIVASRHRAAWLRRCLLSLRQQQYPAFEVIVVADAASLDAVDTRGCKTVPFDVPNLAQARNLGLSQASGDVCAFIDDDGAAEPMWLHHLAVGFQNTSSDGAVGFVRGRNGITFQSQALSVDREAETHVEPVPNTDPYVPTLEPGRAVKLVGTNMAVRRDMLLRANGFDEAYRYFLEDADLSLRLSGMGVRIAVVPLAQVHHGFAPSIRRSARRAPLDLFDIGRSTAHYLRKHLGAASEELWQRTADRERARLLKHMVLGTCEPRDVSRRLDSLRRGWVEAESNTQTEEPQFAALAVPFANISGSQREHIVYASRWFVRRPALKTQARAAVASGGVASVFSFTLTSLRHHVRYTEDGFWLQTGGVFGRSERSGSRIKWCRFAERVGQEIRRVAKERGISETDGGKWWDQSRS